MKELGVTENVIPALRIPARLEIHPVWMAKLVGPIYGIRT
jgi:hypothetical protein